MNIQQEMEPGPGESGTIAGASVHDLIQELKARSNAVIVCLLVDDEEGDESLVIRHLGSRILCVGMLRDAEATLIRTGFD